MLLKGQVLWSVGVGLGCVSSCPNLVSPFRNSQDFGLANLGSVLALRAVVSLECVYMYTGIRTLGQWPHPVRLPYATMTFDHLKFADFLTVLITLAVPLHK